MSLKIWRQVLLKRLFFLRVSNTLQSKPIRLFKISNNVHCLVNCSGYIISAPAPYTFAIADFTFRYYLNHKFPQNENQNSIPKTQNYTPEQTMYNYLQTMYKNTQKSYLSPIKIKTEYYLNKTFTNFFTSGKSYIFSTNINLINFFRVLAPMWEKRLKFRN